MKKKSQSGSTRGRDLAMSEHNFQIIIRAAPNLVRVEFGAPIDGFGMESDRAEDLAKAILKAVEDSRKPAPPPVSGLHGSAKDFDAAINDAFKKL